MDPQEFGEFLLVACLAISVVMIGAAFEEWRDDGFRIFKRRRTRL